MSDETNNNEDEPSIEEILSSIRDIISEEDEDGTVDAANAAPAEKTKAEEKPAEVQPEAQEEVPEAAEETPDASADDNSNNEDDDVLELTDLADEVEPAGDTEDDDSDNNDPLAGIDLNHPNDDDLDISENDDSGIDDILGEDDEPEADIFEPAPVQDRTEELDGGDGALVDRVAESATVGAMAKLAENIAITRKTEGVTLEDIVKESLRPMLKDWLDENLPSIIERLVSQELERLANKATGK